jgi:hypothetical protein
MFFHIMAETGDSSGSMRCGGTFPTTHWSVMVTTVQAGSSHADQALAKLCEIYLLGEEIAPTVTSSENTDDEIRFLFASLGGRTGSEFAFFSCDVEGKSSVVKGKGQFMTERKCDICGADWLRPGAGRCDGVKTIDYCSAFSRAVRRAVNERGARWRLADREQDAP